MMEGEHSRKRKKSGKQSEKLKVPKMKDEPVAPPLPPLPASDSHPPLPHSDRIPLLPHQAEEPDGELDMSTELANHDMPVDGDVVLPTVPSLSDLMAHSDICGSIASADSSPTANIVGQTPEIANSLVESVSQTSSISNESVLLEQQERHESAEDVVCPKSNKSDNIIPSCQEEFSTDAGGDNELVQHAHALLDSTLDVKTEPSERGAGLNDEGFKIRTLNLVRDIVPSYQNEVLPEGWKELTHNTGMPIYCHIASRVVTWSRPYFLENRYAKSHDVPVCAIPCMIYRKIRDEQEKRQETCQVSATSNPEQAATPNMSEQPSIPSKQPPTSSNSEPPNASSQPTAEQSSATKPDTQEHGKDAPLPDSSSLDSVTVKTEPEETKANVSNEEHHERFLPLSADEFKNYCRSVFYFDTKEVKQFSSWKLRKEHEKKLKAEQKQLMLSKDATPRTIIPVTELPEEFQRDDRGKLKRDFIVINGTQTIVDIFHQYANWRSRKPPFVKIKAKDEGFECIIATSPLGDLMGTGEGITRKLAKENAAVCAMRVLIPRYADKLIENAIQFGDREKTEAGMGEYYKIFDTMTIKDQRVVEVAKATNQLYPFIVLKTCLARNFAMTDKDINVNTYMEKQSNRVSLVCDMSVGKYSVKGAKGKNTKMAQHVAAQDILQQLHPHLNTWGAILRLYGKFSDGSSEDIRHKSGFTGAESSLCLSADHVEQEVVKVKLEKAIELVEDVEHGKEGDGVARATCSVERMAQTTESGNVKKEIESVEKSGQISYVRKTDGAAKTEDNVGCVSSDKQAAISDFGSMVNVKVLQENKFATDSISGTCVSREFTTGSSQTDIGGMNAFFSKKNLKPFVVLDEGVTAYECYSSNCGSYVLLAETGVQTLCVGHSTFHKATQMPEMSYNPYTNKNVIKPATETSAGSQQGQSPVTPKVEPVVKGRLHKATQYPDKEYADPGHPPPPVIHPDAQLYAQQQALLQQALLQQQLAFQQQQQLALQQQYFYLDPSSGLPLSMLQPQQMLSDQQQWATQQQPWVYPQQYPSSHEQQ
ncbi:uncharacterized protein [Watersipora subatra]|uniref:uncharacterized protein n=1 Tax=Watersipora subatra TaxID=2589382 RepID=UPI00355B141B